MPLRPGERFGRYELSELLGKGGMGEVYSAHDSILHRKVALKVLTAPSGSSDTAPSSASGGASRILREARAAAGIAHPNAVSIYDVGEVDGVPFLAMELVAGRTLRAFIGDPGVALGRRIRWIADVARALGAAHQLGLVHRDIKPENVMVRDDGLVKVLDFGIARRAVEKQDERPPPNPADLAALAQFAVTSGTLTAEGVVVGTPMYMAPEQMRGEPLDGRTDQFAWGVLAYEVLTGKLPWDGDGASMLSQVLMKTVSPLTDTSREIPAPVDTVVRKALSKMPADRFATMEAIADELEPFASTSGATGRRERVSIPVRGMELAATEQIAISSSDVQGQSGASALTMGRTGPVAERRGRWAMTFAAIAFAAVLGGVWSIRALTGSHGARVATVDASSMADVPSQMSSNPDATAAYRAGLQAVRDGSMLAAIKQFSRAVKLDPLFAAAHLRLALTNLLDLDVLTLTNADLQGAHTSQAALGTHDKILLDAFEPIARVPPDFKESERVLQAAAQRYPNDADFPFHLGLVFGMASESAEAVKALDASIARDPAFAFAWRMKAAALIDLDDVAGAMNAFEQCLKVSPGSTTCLADEMRIQANDGQCEELVRSSRRLISLLPDAWEPYIYLAQGLVGGGEPVDATRAALQQARDRTPAPGRPLKKALAEAALEVVAGDFVGADGESREAERLSAMQTDEAIKVGIAYDRTLLAMETGRHADARRFADAYLRQRAGLSETGEDNSLTLEAAEVVAGGMTRLAFNQERDQWLARNPDAAPVGRWLAAYALPVKTRDDAVAALAAKPDVHPLVSRTFLVPSVAEPIGRTYLLAGQPDEAIPYLRSASASCSLLSGSDVMYSTWASLELGHSLELRADVPGACEAYNRVLARWTPALRVSKTAAEALQRKRALGCRP